MLHSRISRIFVSWRLDIAGVCLRACPSICTETLSSKVAFTGNRQGKPKMIEIQKRQSGGCCRYSGFVPFETSAVAMWRFDVRS